MLIFVLLLTLVVGISTAQTDTHPRCASIDDQISEVIRVSDAPDGVSPFCNIIAENGEFTRDGSEIGNKGVVDRGVIHAVDIFTVSGEQPIGASACLRGTGDLLFLDSRTAPRTLMVLQTTRIGNFTCGLIPSAGMAVLVEPEEGSSGASIETITPDDPDEPLAGDGDADVEVEGDDESATTEESSTSAVVSGEGRSVTNCRVTTNDILNLRDAPTINSNVIDLVPYDITLQATEIADGWVRVVYLNGQGWLSESYLRFSSGCNA